MRLFGYYALHSFVNQVKKLFKTWVMIFIAVCFLVGILIGLFAAAVSEHVDQGRETEITEEIAPQPEEAEPEISFSEAMGIRDFDMLELIIGGILLGMFVFMAMSAEKNGSAIFLPADVSLLFPSPMLPQSVLLFRLMCHMSVALIGSVYMLFQLPNLTLNMGLNIGGAIALIAAYGFSIIFASLIQVLLYTITSTHEKFRKYLRPGVYAILLLIVGGFLLTRNPEQGLLASAAGYFNSDISRFIPIWGWLKGFCIFAVQGNGLGVLACLGALIAGGALMIYIIWSIKADFYEDAMAKSEETAALMERAKTESSTGVIVKRKKDRSEKLSRDGLKHGWGANVYFFKTMYNRRRFSHFGFLTKTMETYFVTAIAVGLLCRLAIGTTSTLPLVFTLGGFAFFRTLGNPLEQDTGLGYFVLIPENAWAKLFWSLMGGTVCCFLDMLLPMILGAVVLGVNPLTVLMWLPLILSVDFYGTNVGVFINLSVPGQAGQMVKQLIQILFIYFGLLPDIVILVLGVAFGHVLAAALAATFFNFLLGFLFFGLSPIFIDP